MRKVFLSTFLLASILLLSGVKADIGPKPEVDIQIDVQGEPVQDQVFYARMLECNERELNLSDYAAPLEIEELDSISIFDANKGCTWQIARLAWGGECRFSECSFWYMPPREFRLAVYLPSEERTYISGDAERINFYSTFKASLESDGTISIKETTPPFNTDAGRTLMVDLIITVIIELAIGSIYVVRKAFSRKVLLYILIANLISIPIVHLLLPMVFTEFFSLLLISELFAIFLEAGLFHLFDKNTFPMRKAILFSFILNIISFLIGGFVQIILFLF